MDQFNLGRKRELKSDSSAAKGSRAREASYDSEK
jgi:hypothetical protein